MLTFSYLFIDDPSYITLKILASRSRSWNPLWCPRKDGVDLQRESDKDGGGEKQARRDHMLLFTPN